MHAVLALACLALLLVIAAQDWLYKPLRNETISAGLTGPYHVLLDVAYVPLAGALLFAFSGWMRVFATISAVALLLVAATNTGHAFFDRITGGKHALWHNRFTLVVFTSALALQIAGDHGWRWALTAANVVMPVAIYFYFSERKSPIDGTVVAPSPAAEKVFVFWLCAWLIVCTA